MKNSLVLLGLIVLSLSRALAQDLSVELILDQEQYLPHESLVAKVRITNFSGQRLDFGKDNDWLQFSIDGRRGFIVPQLDTVPVKGDFTLQNAEVATRRVDLAPCFDLSRPGHYRVTATARVDRWQKTIKSEVKDFDIVPGSQLWEQVFGVPDTQVGPNGTPEARKYALIQVSHLKDLRLYMRVSDPSETKVFKVFPLGNFVTFSDPEHQLDKYNNLHVLYQDGARTFNYSVINPDGLLISRETHAYAQSRPKLRAGDDGRISVVGGVRRHASTDLPPPSLSSLEPSNTNDVVAPKKP